MHICVFRLRIAHADGVLPLPETHEPILLRTAGLLVAKVIAVV